jgi:hypothetical protein
MTTSQKLQSAREAVDSIPQPLRSAWVSVQALRQVRNEHAAALRFELLAHSHPRPLDIGNCMDGPFHLSRVPRNQEHLTLVNLITLGETLPEFIEADKVLPRLVSEVRDLEAQLQREIDSASRAEQDRRDAIEAARAEALAEIDARFAEPEPEPPTPPEPEKPFRGKVTRETAEV